MIIRLFAFISCLILGLNSSIAQEHKTDLPQWQEGYFDIHHINTGRGDTTYFIFPDGTEMFFDVGDLGHSSLPQHKPLQVAPARPNDSKMPGEWVFEYIKQVRPNKKPLKIDYVVISHFHEDHYGNAKTRTKKSNSGGFIRTGVTELGDLIPIVKLIDRGAPDYNIPVNLKEVYGKTLINYLAFVEEKRLSEGLEVESLLAGSKDQISMRYNLKQFPSFSVRNVKANGTIWSGTGNNTFEYFDPQITVEDENSFNGNPFSLALELSYGDFDYFTGGDMTGLQGFGLPPWFDVETPVAKAIGQVDALALNHHGNRDATNENFLKALSPQTIIQQSWVSDHPGSEVLHRMISEDIYPGSRDIFSTSMANETKVAIGPWLVKSYTSFEGHIVIRVNPDGKQYFVYVLNDQSEAVEVKARYGPFKSN